MLTIGQFSLQSIRGRHDIATTMGTYLYSVLSPKVTVDIYLVYGFVTEIWKNTHTKKILRVNALPENHTINLSKIEIAISYN